VLSLGQRHLLLGKHLDFVPHHIDTSAKVHNVNNILIPIAFIFILFMPNYLSFSCYFFFILTLFKTPGSGIRIQATN
jgi:hypothetical protein